MGQLAGMVGVDDGNGGTIRKVLNTLEAIPDASLQGGPDEQPI
jgi:hypothetical protein